MKTPRHAASPTASGVPLEPLPEILLVDLGNVIAHFNHHLASRAIASLPGSRASKDEVHAHLFGETGWEGLTHLLETGELDEFEFEDRCRERFGFEAAREDFVRAWSDIFRIDEAMVEWLGSAALGGRRLALLSNTSELHWRWIAAMEPRLEGLFERLALSHRLRARKPDPEFFRRALADWDVDPARALFLDDMEKNVRSARESGIRAHRYTTLDDLKAAFDAG